MSMSIFSRKMQKRKTKNKGKIKENKREKVIFFNK